ncbi:WD40 repeat-like protein [Cylindrobasidium torrendii FP15055 ss-10]|uniref:methylated diphthine methylhydrolase n=1 Tax=Cylindrobasidium torrendii FP15055 ss-10 TaxID=1314674 RepID=A0A0D7BM29_9AGAR|nr:WD40 repeat-like protein [Cylindrobasidium torrendii FP15055 ss-10]
MFDTVWPADSAEFCPNEGFTDVFAVGTYKLEEDEEKVNGHQQRRGQCMLFKMNEDETDFAKIGPSFKFAAVLDLKWCHRDVATLAVADSESNVALLEWDTDEKVMKQTQSLAVTSSTANLCLSIDWSNRRTGGSGLGSLAVSLSNGSLAVLRESMTGELGVDRIWHGHDFEPWIAAWNYWDTNILFSGGDDLQLKGWDIRTDLSQPAFVNKRFEAGVTTIQSHPHVEHLIAVGGYNNIVQLFDVRMPSRALCGVDVGGGAWRVKWHPSAARKDDLLVACMHDGCKVVNFTNSWKEGQTTSRFDKHESMAYGADWSYSGREGKTSVVSCSFYDHVLHTWKA